MNEVDSLHHLKVADEVNKVVVTAVQPSRDAGCQLTSALPGYLHLHAQPHTQVTYFRKYE